VLFEDFRRDPERHPLKTPSGRIEIVSDAVAAFGYPDCPPHPAWLPPAEWLGAAATAQFHLVTHQPASRLHSQMDAGPVSQQQKVAGREPIRINPADAAGRGIAAGDVVRVFNGRGACLAGAVLDADVMPGVAVMATGAWFDPPAEPGEPERHGNPNVLTLDIGTSTLAQGTSALTTLVEIERWNAPLPPVRVFTPPVLVATSAG
jgi:biotin/methionine sulfoxide reductase